MKDNNTEKQIYKSYVRKNGRRYRLNYRLNQLTNTFFHKEYKPNIKRVCGKKIGSVVDGNDIIGKLIQRGTPFWVSRYGNSERILMQAILTKRYYGTTNNLEKAGAQLCDLSGFFPNDLDLLEKYTDLVLSYSDEIDAHGTWLVNLEEYLISRFSKDTKLFQFGGLDPWTAYASDGKVLPWSHYLKGKKVLVIHPFADSIKNQYEKNRSHIFDSRYPDADDILPEFELKTLKSVQTLAGEKDDRFNDWFEALDWMVSECRKIDFDIAILGCGAYGFPLAGEIKRMGKSAIQMCGTTQLLFGITGNRWENNSVIQSMVNEYWTYPLESERISNTQRVETGCYW